MRTKQLTVLLIVAAVVLVAASAGAWYFFGGVEIVRLYVVPLLGVLGCSCLLFAVPKEVYDKYSFLVHVRNAVVFMAVAFILLMILGGLGILKK